MFCKCIHYTPLVNEMKRYIFETAQLGIITFYLKKCTLQF